MEQGLAVNKVLFDEAGNPKDCNFLYVNASFERLTGFKSQDILGKTLAEMMPDSQHFLIEKYARLIKLVNRYAMKSIFSNSKSFLRWWLIPRNHSRWR